MELLFLLGGRDNLQNALPGGRRSRKSPRDPPPCTVHGARAAAIEAMRERAQRSEQHVWEAELHRNEGELRRAAGHSLSDVEEFFGKALDVSRAQGARIFELRAATSLARLWRDQGKQVDARELLAPLHDWFIEGIDTVDLKDAKALLAQLGA